MDSAALSGSGKDDSAVEPSTSNRQIIQVEKRFCPHCNKTVSFKTFKAHKRLHYDSSNKKWLVSTPTLPIVFESNDKDAPTSLGLRQVEVMDQSIDYMPPSSIFDELTADEKSDDSSTDGEVSSSELWDGSDEEEFFEDIEPPSIQPQILSESATEYKMKVLMKWIVLFMLYLRRVYAISDAVSGLILKFFSILFNIIGKMFPPCFLLAKLPSIYKMRKLFGETKEFKRYVACRKCHTLYELQHCKNSNNTSKRCKHAPFPNHPQERMRRPCDTMLLKAVELASRRVILYPYRVYCYLSIEKSLQSLFSRPSFIEDCEKWRGREVIPNTLCDVYDGKIWNEFLNYNGEPFLSAPYAFGLTLNLDWFQPFKHSTYSIGAIYLTIMNLPREQRNKPENVLLVGLMPGPQEASNINGYMKPLVNELNEFWKGKELIVSINGRESKQCVRCALLCVSCDLPAGRKVCGFLSFSAHKGCSRCLKTFPGSVGSGGLNYSGFDRNTWKPRNVRDHKLAVSEIRLCKTKAAIASKESECGYRYTELLRLPYFNPTRMLTVDPMHNLFLGSAKHVLKNVWINQNIITECQFDIVQDRVDRIVCPPDIGRIPNKIRSGFSSFTADQYKNWIIYFSLLSLRDIISGNDLECWRHLILACRIISCKQITNTGVKLADALLMQFCRRVENLYGGDIVSPNMHMHAHLCECISDYGPSHVFWLYSFERYNGIMENLPNNNRSVEIQLMRRFLETSVFHSIPSDYQEEFKLLFSQKGAVGTLSQTFDLQTALESRPSDNLLTTLCMDPSQILPKFSSRALFSQIEVEGLKKLYAELTNAPVSEIQVPSAFLKYQQMIVNGKQIGVHRSRFATSSIVMAIRKPSNEERPARVNYFAKHNATIQRIQHTFLLFHASWFKPHRNKSKFGKPITLWESDIFELHNYQSILPVQMIKHRTVSLVDKVSMEETVEETVLLVCPCVDF